MRKLTDPRLLAAAELVRPGGVVADIGADHGYLVCHLVEEGIAVRGYACDIGDKPLARCAETVALSGLEDTIELRLTDGLNGLPLEEIDDIVIAGMGGEMIADIIAGSPLAKDSRLRFILQPMTKAERLRASLYRMGYAVNRERGVEAGGFLYTVMSVSYTGEPQEADELFAWTGLLPRDGRPESRRLLSLTAQRLRQAALGLAQTERGRTLAERYDALARSINEMLKREEG